MCGLLSIGVHQGEHVGVLMATRPSAFTVLAALNRLGAVAVLLRPEGDSVREAELGQITRVITGPELAAHAVAAEIGPVLVLGGGAEDRELPNVTDMEWIDPAEVTMPSWYRPNLGRASDRAEMDNQVQARGVDPAEILLTPRKGQQPSGQSFTPIVIDPEQVRQDADIRAGELERDPDARRLETETTREQALGEVQARQDDGAEIQAAEHPNGAWQGGGPAAQLAGKAYSSDPSSSIPARLGASRKQPITNRDQARTPSRER